MSTITTEAGIKELNSRSADGVEVALLWRQRDNAAVVVVADYRTGAEFVLDVHENDNALDIFHHPYAYAAHRGIDHGWWPADGEELQIAA
jgi:hypothetical protein